jgi:hypothetical protein
MTIQQFVQEQLTRLADQFTKPARPIMSQEEFDALPNSQKMILTCNVIGCKRMVSTHHMLCVEHHTGQEAIEQAPKKGEEHLPRRYVRLSCTCGK